MVSRIRTHLLLQGFHGVEPETGSWGIASWHPRVDIYELTDALLIQVEAPGLRIQDLQLVFEPGQLIVAGLRERPQLPGPARAALVEMNYGPFRRRFPLPADIDGDGIRATYDAGILQIHVPRRPLAKSQPLTVSVE